MPDKRIDQKTEDEELGSAKAGAKFLKNKFRDLHSSPESTSAAKWTKAKNKKVSQKPEAMIANYLQRFHEVLDREDSEKRERGIEAIKRTMYRLHVIKKIPESYYENHKRLDLERGRDDIKITKEIKKQLSEVIISDQKSTLDNWIDYFASSDSKSYPDWAKYWAFRGMLKLSAYDKKKHAFGKRDKGTTAPFPDRDREALAYVVDVVVKKVNKENISDEEDNPEFQELLQGMNFGKLYAYAIEKVTPAEENELLNTKGEWVKYLQDSDHMPLVRSLQGHGTGWCTAGETTAKSQLQGGDFYVYYSYDKQGDSTIPRVAIRMEDSSITEVRGIAHEQNLDSHIGDVVNEKLKEFPDGKAYQKKVADMKRLTEIDKKHKAEEELEKDDLRFLYEIDAKIEGFGYEADPRIQEVLAGRDIKSDISYAIGCSKEQISTTKEEAVKGGIKFHYGNLDLDSLKSTEWLQLPEIMNGDLDLHSLQSAEGLKLPETMNGNLDLHSLQSAEGLKLPEMMNGGLWLSSLQSAEGLKLPKTFNGDLYLSGLQSAEGLKLPKTFNGDLYLSGLQSAEGLKLPEMMNGGLWLSGLQSAEGLKLPKTFNGDLYLGSLQSAEGLKLPEMMNGELYLSGLQSAEGLKLPEMMNGELSLDSLKSAEGLELPKRFNGYLFLGSLQSAEGLKLPEMMNGDLFLGSLQSAEKQSLRRKYPKLKIH